VPGNILNIDDNTAARYIRAHALKGAGFQVWDAPSGGEALELAGQRAFDVAIIDVRLPDMSGLEVTRRLRLNPGTSGVRIAQVSEVCLSDNDETIGLEHGADVYLRSPDPKVLAAVTGTLARLGPRSTADERSRGELGIASVDLAGYFVMTNERYCEILGRDTFELGLHRWIDTVHADDVGRVESLLDEVLAGVGSRFQVRLRQVGSDGSAFWTHNAISVLRGVSGVPRGVVIAASELGDSPVWQSGPGAADATR
jgi:PAS domain S-box-containing protein